MNKLTTVIIITANFFMLFFSGCSTSISSEKEYYSFLANEDNGLSKVKKANGLKLTLKYLPNEYVVWKEYKDQKITIQDKDSLLQINSNSLTFLLTIAPDENSKGDIMYKDVTTLREYKQKAYDMNFGMSDYFTLHAGQEEIKPILVNLENTYSLTDSRNIYLVFSGDKKDLGKEETMEVVFNDELFNTGINHFSFNRKDFLNVPEIKFWNL